MQVNITGITGPQLTGLVATSGVGSVALKWDNPNSQYHKSTEIWASATSDVSSATKLAEVNDYTYVVVDSNPNQPMYYWVRSISTFNRADATFSVSVNKAGNAVTGTAAKMISLGASSQIFSISKAGLAAPATINLFASAQNLQGTPTWSITSGNAALSASANGNAYQQDLTYNSMTTDQVTIQVTQDGMTDQMTIVKVKDGVDTITGMLTNEAANVAADFTGAVSSYANSGGNFKVYQGTTEVTSNSTFSVVSSSNVTMSLTAAGAYLVTAMTADNGSATLRATYGGISVDKIYTITKAKAGSNGTNGVSSNGADGARGTVNLQGSGYSAWSDSAANSVISSNGYGGPQRGDIVTLYNSTFSQTKFYSGGVWNVMTAYINGNLLVAGTLSASQITAGTMAADRISGGSLYLANGNFQVVGSTNSIQIYTGNFTRCTATNGDVNGAIPAFTATSTGAAAAISLNGGSSGNAITITGGNNGIVQNSGGINWLRTLVANGQNTYDLGASDFAWRTVYSYGGYITVSDRRLKEDIVPTPLGLDFISSLRPVAYRLKVGHNKVVDHVLEGPDTSGIPLAPQTELIPQPGVRTHFGLIAQEVQESLVSAGVDNSAIWTLANPDDPASQQALRYEELISPMIKAIQDLKALVDAQQLQIDALVARGA